MNTLKKIVYFFIILSTSVLIFTSCNKNNDLPNASSNKKDILLEMGFEENNIQEFDEYFVIDGDIVFRKENLVKKENNSNIETDTNTEKPTFIPEQIETPEIPDLSTIPVDIPQLPIELRQRRWNDLIGGNTVNNVRLQVHSSISGWDNLIQQAVNAWNNSGSRVNIQVVTNNPHITIYADWSNSCPSSHQNLANDICGRGAFPENQLPGDVISINTDHPTMNTNARRLYVLTHEIGHNLGFPHTDSNDGLLIGGTPTNDASSIMNAGECGSTNTLSTNDIIAVKTLYPNCSGTYGEWSYSNTFGWMFYGGDNWYYFDAKDIWIFIDTNQNLCNGNDWFYTSGNLCGQSGWFFTDIYGWAYIGGNWYYWPNC